MALGDEKKTYLMSFFTEPMHLVPNILYLILYHFN